MNRAARWFSAILLLAWCGLRMGDVPAIAQVAPAVTARSALEYRTIFVPQAQLTKMASGYLPVKRDEFQQLLATINASPSGPGGASVRLTRAEYSARLQGAELVAGAAALQVQHRLPEVATLGLDPCTLAITAPRWGNDSKKPARMGVDGAGRLVVLVEAAAAGAESPMREEDLHFDWSLRGARDPAGVLIFDLQTPACPTSRLTLDLPAGVTPVVGQGVVTALKAAAPPTEAERQTWQIEVGGRTRTTLSIVPNAGMTVNQRYVLLKQSTVYDLTPAALDTTIELDLDIYHEPLRQLTLAASSELQITSVRAGDIEIPWSVAISDAPSVQRLVLEFSEPMQGADRILRVTGVSPMVWDQPWRLPTLQAEGVSWQEGTLTLQSPQAIELRDLLPAHCRQTKF
ncbi:MAG TPA: hypothetical protein VL096_16890, partial [Pirellulaceae bacterium]|nr:hypothetical protein [Pirellulaceae bacterium]